MASWTDPNPTTSTHIRAVQLNELRNTVNRNRAMAGLSKYPWSDGAVVSGLTHIRAPHFSEIRPAIQQYMALGNWTVGSAPSSGRQVSARHQRSQGMGGRVLERARPPHRPCARPAGRRVLHLRPDDQPTGHHRLE